MATTITLATCHQGYGITGGVDPGAVDAFDLTPTMLAWAEAHGLDAGDPAVYVAVSAQAETGEDVCQAIAWVEWDVPDGQAAAVRAAHAERVAARAEYYPRCTGLT